MSTNSQGHEVDRGPLWYIGLTLWFFFVVIAILFGLFVAATKPELPSLPTLPRIPTREITTFVYGVLDLLGKGIVLGGGVALLFALYRLLDYVRTRQTHQHLYEESYDTRQESRLPTVDGLAYDILRVQNQLFPQQLALEPGAALKHLQREILELRRDRQSVRKENETLRQSVKELQQHQSTLISQAKESIADAIQRGYDDARAGVAERSNPHREQAGLAWLAGWQLAVLEINTTHIKEQAEEEKQAALGEVANRLKCLFKTDDWTQIEAFVRRLTTEHRIAYDRLDGLRTALRLDRTLPIVEAAEQVQKVLNDLEMTCAEQEAKLAKVCTKRAYWKKQAKAETVQAQTESLKTKILELEAILGKLMEWQVVDIHALMEGVNYGDETLAKNRWGRRYLQRYRADGLRVVGKQGQTNLPLIGTLEALELGGELPPELPSEQHQILGAEGLPSPPPSTELARTAESREKSQGDLDETEVGEGSSGNRATPQDPVRPPVRPPVRVASYYNRTRARTATTT